MRLIELICGLLTSFWAAWWVVAQALGLAHRFIGPIPHEGMGSLVAFGALGIILYSQQREANWRWWFRIAVCLVFFGLVSIRIG